MKKYLLALLLLWGMREARAQLTILPDTVAEKSLKVYVVQIYPTDVDKQNQVLNDAVNTARITRLNSALEALIALDPAKTDLIFKRFKIVYIYTNGKKVGE